MEEWRIEVSKPEESRTPQEDLQSQLTWTHGGSQRLNPLTKEHRLHTFVAVAQLVLHVDHLIIEAEVFSDSAACSWFSFS